jgi:hypothetical protein
MISAAFLLVLAAAQGAPTPAIPVPVENAYRIWSNCLDERVSPASPLASASRSADELFRACLREESAYTDAFEHWVAALAPDDAERTQLQRLYTRSTNRLRRHVEDAIRELQDQGGNR